MNVWHVRVWCGPTRTARTFAFIAACCVNAWVCNLALNLVHSHALFWCLNTLQSMAMTIMRWCLLDDLLNVWNGYRVLHKWTARTFVFVVIAIYVCVHLHLKVVWMVFHAIWGHSFTFMRRFAVQIYYQRVVVLALDKQRGVRLYCCVCSWANLELLIELYWCPM